MLLLLTAMVDGKGGVSTLSKPYPNAQPKRFGMRRLQRFQLVDQVKQRGEDRKLLPIFGMLRIVLLTQEGGPVS